MNDDRLAKILNSIGFAERYYDLCDRYPIQLGRPPGGTKADIIDVLEASDVEIEYDKRDRSYRLEPKRIGGVEWSGLIVKQRGGGIELMLNGRSVDNPKDNLGDNFAALSRQILEARGEEFTRKPPYPRPAYNGDSTKLKEITAEFVSFYRDCIRALGENQE